MSARSAADSPNVVRPSPPVTREREVAAEPHVVIPDEVNVPLPRETIDEIAVPASINGRSLAGGRP